MLQIFWEMQLSRHILPVKVPGKVVRFKTDFNPLHGFLSNLSISLLYLPKPTSVAACKNSPLFTASLLDKIHFIWYYIKLIFKKNLLFLCAVNNELSFKWQEVIGLNIWDMFGYLMRNSILAPKNLILNLGNFLCPWNYALSTSFCAIKIHFWKLSLAEFSHPVLMHLSFISLLNKMYTFYCQRVFKQVFKKFFFIATLKELMSSFLSVKTFTGTFLVSSG